MKQIMKIGAFKSKSVKLIDEISRTCFSILVTKRNKPVAEPICDKDFSLFGYMKGTIRVKGDIIESTWK